nr:hypothetical protein BaRGS_010334 [Batillaria attramentaria]
MTTVTDVPESTTPQCEGKWSDYIDRDDPSYGGGDKEHIYPAEIANFCPDGKKNFNVVIFSESTNSRDTKLGMLIDNRKTFQNISF